LASWQFERSLELIRPARVLSHITGHSGHCVQQC